MRILAIDPGPEQSGYVIWNTDSQKVEETGKIDNDELLLVCACADCTSFVSEQFGNMGRTVGLSTFTACNWGGRFEQEYRSFTKGDTTVLSILRHEVKTFFEAKGKGPDAQIRAAILDRFGGKGKAIGNKANPGPLYGVKADICAAHRASISTPVLEVTLASALI